MKILIVGDSCLDVYVYGSCRRLCPEAPVPVFEPHSETTNGGMAQNVARNVRALGVDCDVLTHPEWKLVRKTRYVDEHTNQMIVRIDETRTKDDKHPRHIYDARPEWLPVDYSSYDAAIISDYNKGYLDEKTISRIADNSKITFLDTKRLIGEWASKIDFIKINNHEYERTEHLLSEEIKSKIITTSGASGATYRGKKYPVSKVDVRDSSGAGDTFLAALVCRYIQNGNNIDDAIAYANVAATLVVQKRGVSVVGKEEVIYES